MPDVEGDTTVSEFSAADEALRSAFQALGETAEAELSEQDRELIWRAVSGGLPASERRDLVDRAATDPAFAEAWRIAEELWRASQGDVAADLEHRRHLWVPSWVGVAAVLVLCVSAGVGFWLTRPERDVFREQGGYVATSLVPGDAAMPRDAFRLRWTPGPPGTRYQVRVTTENLGVLATATDLTMPEFVVERERLATVSAGSRVLWQVDAALPGGDTVSSQTFVTRVQ
jgi:hypothetical protein